MLEHGESLKRPLFTFSKHVEIQITLCLLFSPITLTCVKNLVLNSIREAFQVRILTGFHIVQVIPCMYVALQCRINESDNELGHLKENQTMMG